MRLEKMADKVYETDVLVIGGGVSGCVAAAKAAKLGAEVIVLEKATLERGGGPAAGGAGGMSRLRCNSAALRCTSAALQPQTFAASSHENR